MDRLSLDEIKVGMKVNPKQLWGIFGVSILLSNFDGDIGEILYIGSPYTDEECNLSKKLREEGKELCCYYEPYDDKEVSWDE